MGVSELRRLLAEQASAQRAADPLLSRENLQPRVPDYTAGHDPAADRVTT